MKKILTPFMMLGIALMLTGCPSKKEGAEAPAAPESAAPAAPESAAPEAAPAEGGK